MNRRDRLQATLRGESVDRPAVSFYELNGLDQDPDDPSKFNIFSDPSWQPLLELAKTETDLIVRRTGRFHNHPPDPLTELTEIETETVNGSLLTSIRIRAGNRILKTRTRRDPDINTVWTEEHLLKNTADLKAYLDLPPPQFAGTVDTAEVLDTEERIGDRGIVMLDIGDPLARAASLFDLAEYTIAAMTEQKLFHQLLERFAALIIPQVEALARALPGRLWRVYGPEYASEPYLPPTLFREYVCRYDRPMIEAIQRFGGYARIHSHGRLRNIIADIAALGTDGLDPIEPPPQGDMELIEVRRRYGRQMVLFGNLEVSDIETLPTPQFRDRVRRALNEGTAGTGRGFVLMPSACPYGRHLSSLTLNNYETIIEVLKHD